MFIVFHHSHLCRLLSDFLLSSPCKSSFVRLSFYLLLVRRPSLDFSFSFPLPFFGLVPLSVIFSSRSEKLNHKFLTSLSLVLSDEPAVLGRDLLSSAVVSIISFRIESFLIFIYFSFTLSLKLRVVFFRFNISSAIHPTEFTVGAGLTLKVNCIILFVFFCDAFSLLHYYTLAYTSL